MNNLFRSHIVNSRNFGHECRKSFITSGPGIFVHACRHFFKYELLLILHTLYTWLYINWCWLPIILFSTMQFHDIQVFIFYIFLYLHVYRLNESSNTKINLYRYMYFVRMLNEKYMVNVLYSHVVYTYTFCKN